MVPEHVYLKLVSSQEAPRFIVGYRVSPSGLEILPAASPGKWVDLQVGVATVFELPEEGYGLYLDGVLYRTEDLLSNTRR